jgi:hypothetical protein
MLRVVLPSVIVASDSVAGICPVIVVDKIVIVINIYVIISAPSATPAPTAAPGGSQSDPDAE